MGRAFDRVFRNPRTGAIVIAQMPNLPLGLFLAATAVRVLSDLSGTVGTAIAVVGAVALTWWAGAEILRGESLFRRILGGVVLVMLAAGQLMR